MNRKNLLTLLVPMAFLAGVSAQAQEAKLVKFSTGASGYLNKMSDNGRWATRQSASDSEAELNVKLIDLQSGKTIEYTPEKCYDYTGKEKDIVAGMSSVTTDVSDDGGIIAGSFDGKPAYYNVSDKSWHQLSMGGRTENRNLSGSVTCMSPDGEWFVGWFSQSFDQLIPGLWHNDKLVATPNLPKYDEMYERGIIGADDYKEAGGKTPSYAFFNISADGKKILVGIDHHHPGWGCSFVVYDVANDTYDWMSGPGISGLSFVNDATMSNNGLWVTGTVHVVEPGDIGANEYDIPFVYNTDTKEFTQIEYDGSIDVFTTAIGNSGTLYGAAPGSLPTRSVYIYSEGLWVSLEEMLKQKYDIDYKQATGYDLTGFVCSVSDDEKTLVSQAEFRDGAFVLTLPVTFAEASKGVNLLEKWAVSPGSGSQFSTLKEVNIRFPYSCEPVKGAKVTVTKDGTKVAESIEIKPYNEQKLIYTIVFNDVKLAAGQKYLLKIPAASFVIPNTSVKNNDIEFSYTGRADTPVAPVQFSPAQGSAVRQFDQNSPVVVTFDTEVTLRQGATVQFFEEGKSTPLTSLICLATGKSVTFYPPTSRLLTQNINYQIKVSANTVRDITGNCGNEEFTINLVGAYKYEPPTDPTKPFFDDFNNPNQSLGVWMQYEGDHNEPSEDMAALGFDKDNTPWNFSVRDNESYDYCAMAHSIFANPGKADDWMSTHAISVPNEHYYLSFKAQSYKKNKTDKLKVIVWASDENLSSLDKSTVDKMRQNGDVICNETLKPLADGSTLTGGWKNFEYSLAAYKGKKIYIAFVNENENQSGVFVDDVAVVSKGNIIVQSATESTVVAQDEVTVKGIVTIQADKTYSTLKAKVESGDFKDEIELKGLSLKKGDKKEFEFAKKMPVELGKSTSYTITVDLDGDAEITTSSIKNLAFEAKKRVLIEEGTGMWCGNCPYGEVALGYLEESMPDNIAVISVHQGDTFEYTQYDQFLSLGGYPNGRIDRSEKVYGPMAVLDGNISYQSASGDESFTDAVLAALENAPEAEISIGDVVLYTGSMTFKIPVDVRFSLDNSNVNYNVFAVVVEDGLVGYQTNYFAGTDIDDPMTWWRNEGEKVRYTYSNVARGVMDNQLNGVNGYIPKNVTAGTVYSSLASMALPNTVKNRNNVKFVVALIDAGTGAVINSAVADSYVEKDGTGVDNVTTDTEVSVRISNGTVYVNGNSDGIEVYNMQGMRVANEALNGLYVIRTVVDNEVFATRVLVR